MCLKEIEETIKNILETQSDNAFKVIYPILNDEVTEEKLNAAGFECIGDWITTFGDYADILFDYFNSGVYYDDLIACGMDIVPFKESIATATDIDLIGALTHYNFSDSAELLAKVESGKENTKSLYRRMGVFVDTDKDGKVIYSGYMGDCSWTIDNDIMTISPDTPRACLGNTGSAHSEDWHDLDVVRKIKKVVITDNIRAGRSMRYFFCNMENLEEIECLERINTEQTVNMSGVFSGCSKLKRLDLSQWDVSNVEDMSFMFFGCESLKTIDTSFWDTWSLKRMGNMFAGCESLETIELDSFDTSSVEMMCGLFDACHSIKYLGGLSGWKVHNCRSFECAFADCTALEYLDLSKWWLSSAEDVSGMFSYAENLRDLKLPKFSGPIKEYTGIFAHCPAGEKIIEALKDEDYYGF